MATITAVDTSQGAWERVKSAGRTAWGKIKSWVQRAWSWGTGLVKRGWNWLTRNKATQWVATKAKVAGNFVWRVIQSPVTWAIGIVLLVPTLVWVIIAVLSVFLLFSVTNRIMTIIDVSSTPEELWRNMSTNSAFERLFKDKSKPVAKASTGPVVSGDVVQETTTVTYLSDFRPDLITDPEETLEDRREALVANVEIAAERGDMDTYSSLTGRLHMVLTRLGDTPKWGPDGAGPNLAPNVRPDTAWPHIKARVQEETPDINWNLDLMNQGLKAEEARLRKQAGMKANR